MQRILTENHFLGRFKSKEEQIEQLKSEKQDRFIRTKEQRQEIKTEIQEGQAPPILREEFKEKIERQNF